MPGAAGLRQLPAATNLRQLVGHKMGWPGWILSVCLLSASAGCKSPSTELFPDADTDLSVAADLGPRPDLRAAGGRGYVVVVGGGAEDDFGVSPSWSQRAYGYIVTHAGRGKVVILSTASETEWLPDYFRKLGASDAQNVLIADRATAQKPETAALIDAASAVFIKGGDQAKYVTLWGGTGVSDALGRVYQRGGVLAGTSAGAHVLSQVVFDAQKGSLGPVEAIQNGRSALLSFSEDFVRYVPAGTPDATAAGTAGVLPRVLIDTHFTTRGRLARLGVMLANRLQARPGVPLLGVGLDEKTALLIDPQLVGEVAGQGAVTLLRAVPQTRVSLQDKRPPAIANLECDQLTEGYSVDLLTGQILRRSPGATSLPEAAQPGVGRAVRIGGSRTEDTEAGGARLKDVATEERLLRRGLLVLVSGRGDVPQGLVVTQVFAASALIENRLGGLMWGLTRPENLAARVGIALDQGAAIRADASGVLDFVAEGTDDPESAALIVDGRAATLTAQSTYVVEPMVSMQPRQSVAIEHLRVHWLPTGSRMNLASREISF